MYLTVEKVWPGDLNDDDFVGADDLDIVRAFWGEEVSAGSLLHGDPSGDGFVGADDLDIIRAHWGEGTPPVPGSIPEPSLAVALLGAGVTGVVLLAGRRRRS